MSTTTTDKFTVEFAADLTEAVDGVLHVARNRRDRWSREVSIGETARTLLRNWPDHREDIRTALRDVCLEYGLLGKVETTEIDGLIAGALKPTSVYSVTRIENSLVVVAHLSEGIPRHWLLDNTALEAFLSNELEYGLRQAVEAKVLADINGTSGTQAQAYATSVLATLRKGITKLETAGYTASAYILHPADSESVELALSSVAAVEHLSLPYDPATRRLFGVPVTSRTRRRWRRARNRHGRSRFGHRHPRRGRAMVGERDRR